MSRRKNAPIKGPTPEQVKALSDQLSMQEQHELYHLYTVDPRSRVGQLFRASLTILHNDRLYFEKLAGLAPGDVDEEQLLTTKETDKQAKKRTGRKSENAVKQARHRAKKSMSKAIPPPSSVPLG